MECYTFSPRIAAFSHRNKLAHGLIHPVGNARVALYTHAGDTERCAGSTVN